MHQNNVSYKKPIIVLVTNAFEDQQLQAIALMFIQILSILICSIRNLFIYRVLYDSSLHFYD